MIKKLYSQKDGVWIKMERALYKTLKKSLAEDQIAEFYLSFERYVHSEDATIKDIIMNMCALAELINEDNFLYQLNINTDKDGNVDWKELLSPYKSEDDIKVIYR